MLPYKSSEGKEAFRRIRTYIGEPDRMNEEPEEIDVREGNDLQGRNYVKLGEVSKSIGWKPKVETNE
jgi:large subunit ribosomal protein L13